MLKSAAPEQKNNHPEKAVCRAGFFSSEVLEMQQDLLPSADISAGDDGEYQDGAGGQSLH